MKRIERIRSLALILVVSVGLGAGGCSTGSTPVRATEPEEGRLVFREPFDADLSNWKSEGPYLAEVKDGRLHLKTTWGERKVGQYVWCRRELPADFRMEYDFTPVSDGGFFLIFFCVQGVGGEDILGPELFDRYMNFTTWEDYQDFDKYTSPPNRRHESRIRCYHTSYRRGTRANCNLRKNPGLNLVKSSDIDQLLPKDKTVHVVLVKKGGRIVLTVDDRTFMDYTDEVGFYDGGRLGFRQVYDSEGVYDNVAVYDLTAEER